MNIDNLLRDELSVPDSKIESIEVKYPKKISYKGMISQFHHSPIKLVLSLRDFKSIEDKYHEVDFDKAEEIAIRYFDGRISVHEDSKYVN